MLTAWHYIVFFPRPTIKVGHKNRTATGPLLMKIVCLLRKLLMMSANGKTHSMPEGACNFESSPHEWSWPIYATIPHMSEGSHASLHSQTLEGSSNMLPCCIHLAGFSYCSLKGYCCFKIFRTHFRVLTILKTKSPKEILLVLVAGIKIWVTGLYYLHNSRYWIHSPCVSLSRWIDL